jgi:hypothetical protein
MKKAILGLITTGLLSFMLSCSSPLDKKYNEASLGEDLEEIALKEKGIDTTDAKYFVFMLVGAKLRGDTLENKTYRELFDEAKVLRKEHEADE